MFKRAITEGLKSISRSIWLSITAITVLTVSLASVYLIIGVSVTVGYAVRNLDTLVSFPAFFKENVSEDAIYSQILPALKTNPKVKSVDYLDKEKAKKKLEEGSVGFVSSYLSKDENYAWRYVLITPDKSEDYGEMIRFVKDGQFKDSFDSVPRDENFVNQLLKFYSWINYFGVALILIFSFISILVMSNVIRMTNYNHREEIEILRLVGATNGYIRGPFVAQGVIYNIFSAGIVGIFFAVLISVFLPTLRGWIFGGASNGLDISPQLYLSLLASILASILLGIITVHLSIRRYLRI